jgi:hypothetical protein
MCELHITNLDVSYDSGTSPVDFVQKLKTAYLNWSSVWPLSKASYQKHYINI